MNGPTSNMGSANSSLFTAVKLGATHFANRIFMAPMTRNRAPNHGIPSALNATYYAQRASAGLIVTEGTYPHSSGRAYVNQPGISNPDQVTGWKLVTDAVHHAGGRIFLQILHPGRITHEELTGGQQPVSASPITPKGEVHLPNGQKASYPEPRALRIEEIPAIIEMYRSATERAFEAGFDGVELHAANGYLPHVFLSNRTNLRSDNYGGSIPNRIRFTFEILKAMIAVKGSGYVGAKFSVGEFARHDISIDDEAELFPALAAELDRLDLAYVHVQQPITDWGANPVPYDSFQLFRRNFCGPIIGGATFNRETATKAIESGSVDAVSFGRLFLANPDLPTRFRKRARLNAADLSTAYTPGEKGYTDYPFLETTDACRTIEKSN
jgi:N-ethylmaleimide reductase